MKTQSLVHRYSPAEEIAHSITHGLGALMSVVGLAVLVGFASRDGTASHVAGCSIFGGSLFLMYLSSTLYHSIPLEKAKRVLRTFDHVSIYLLIAGSYTPFTLASLDGASAWALLGLVWSLALTGVILKIAAPERFSRTALCLYLGMGWMSVLVARPVFLALDSGGILLVVIGGLAYTVGVVFYLWRRLPYHHAIWHLFVLGGSASHFFAVLFYVIPPGPHLTG